MDLRTYATVWRQVYSLVVCDLTQIDSPARVRIPGRAMLFVCNIVYISHTPYNSHSRVHPSL